MRVAAGLSAKLLSSTLFDRILSPDWLSGIRLLLAGTGLLIVFASILPGELAHLSRNAGLFIVVGCAAVCVTALQLLPQTLVAQSIWSQASDALGTAPSGRVTLDLEATTDALRTITVAVTSALLFAAIGIERRRAEWMLLALAIVCPLIALTNVDPATPDARGIGMRVVAIMCGTGLFNLAVERIETRARGDRARLYRYLAFGAVAVATVLAAGAMLVDAGLRFWLVTIDGVALYGSMFVSRRFGWGPWMALAIFALATTGCVIAASHIPVANAPVSLAFAAMPKRALELTTSMMGDVPFMGTGAGTMPVYNRLYRGFGDPVAYDVPSDASAVIVEYGLTLAVLLLLSVLAAVVVLVVSASSRGRDAFYSLNGAAVLLVAALLSFNCSFLRSQTSLLVLAAVLGLAAAQRRGRRL